MAAFMTDFLDPDRRPSKNGWWTGMYFCRCRNCNKEFSGTKGAWTCSDCAYDFDEQLQYEQLWRDVGFINSVRYVARIVKKNKANKL